MVFACDKGVCVGGGGGGGARGERKVREDIRRRSVGGAGSLAIGV